MQKSAAHQFLFIDIDIKSVRYIISGVRHLQAMSQYRSTAVLSVHTALSEPGLFGSLRQYVSKSYLFFRWQFSLFFHIITGQPKISLSHKNILPAEHAICIFTQTGIFYRTTNYYSIVIVPFIHIDRTLFSSLCTVKDLGNRIV